MVATWPFVGSINRSFNINSTKRNKSVVEEEELTIDNSTFKKMSLSALDKAQCL